MRGYQFCGVSTTPRGMGFSPTLFILWLRAILINEDILRPGWSCFRFQRLGISEKIPRVAISQF